MSFPWVMVCHPPGNGQPDEHGRKYTRVLVKVQPPILLNVQVLYPQDRGDQPLKAPDGAWILLLRYRFEQGSQ